MKKERKKEKERKEKEKQSKKRRNKRKRKRKQLTKEPYMQDQHLLPFPINFEQFVHFLF